eukprot:1070074-Pyramimonas_sp.AAC.1
MMVDSGAAAASHAAPHEIAESSPTKDVPSSSDEEAAPAVKASPPAIASSGHDAAEPPSADRTPGVPDTPGSLEASPDLAQLNDFPYQEDPELIHIEEEHYRSGPASANFFCRARLPPSPDKRQRKSTDGSPREGDQEINVGHAYHFRHKEFYLSLEDRTRIINNAPIDLKRRVPEALPALCPLG